MLATESIITSVLARDVSSLISELAKRISYPVLADELTIPDALLQAYQRGVIEYPRENLWKLIRTAYKHDFFDLLPAHGVPVISYDIGSSFDIEAFPLGYDDDPPVLPLLTRPTKIAGFPVDFPLGLPASVLAANAGWIEFYARRGFDILTYKTVRTAYRAPHPFPNWVFVQNPLEVADHFEAERYQAKKGFEATAIGYPGYWPEDLRTVSMANSFGVPSLAPNWWKEDISRARNVIREGHQVLIVSVIGSKQGVEMADDLIEAAVIAKAAGADIIEANFSCPNVSGDRNGELYHFPEEAASISAALKAEIGSTPLFVKIGYLPEPQLRQFVALNTAVDGIVAINTIGARVVDDKARQTFPDSTFERSTAGISGWSIKDRAQEVARNLVSIRRDLCAAGRRPFTILGVGGVTESAHCFEYLDDIGVDGVESCTGAFLNPHLGLDVRWDPTAPANQRNRLEFELTVIGTFFRELMHPTKSSRIRTNPETGQVLVERR